MKTKQEHLITDLIERTKRNMNEVQRLKELSNEELNLRLGEGSWSILECIEHLNLYGNYYLQEIQVSLYRNRSIPGTFFKSGLLGGFFAQSMLPKEKLNKMKTFKKKNPIGRELDRGVLERFLEQQKRMLEYLNTGRQVNLEETRTSITFSRWIKLKLGDTFRFVIYHNERHIIQAFRVLEAKSHTYPAQQASLND